MMALYYLLGGAKTKYEFESLRKTFGVNSYAMRKIDDLQRRSNTELGRSYRRLLPIGFRKPSSPRIQERVRLLAEEFRKSTLLYERHLDDLFGSEEYKKIFGQDIESVLYDAWREIKKVKTEIKTRADLERIVREIRFVEQRGNQFCLCFAVNNVLMLAPESKVEEPVPVSEFFKQCFISRLHLCEKYGFFNIEVGKIIVKSMGLGGFIFSLSEYDKFPDPHSTFFDNSVFTVKPSLGTVFLVDGHFVAVIPLENTYKDGVLNFYLYLDSLQSSANIYTHEKLKAKLKGSTMSLLIF